MWLEHNSILSIDKNLVLSVPAGIGGNRRYKEKCFFVLSWLLWYHKEKNLQTPTDSTFVWISSMWIMWINLLLLFFFRENHTLFPNNYPQEIVDKISQFLWIMWVTDYLIKSSPIFTTFPAPMVINKSPSIHFFDKNSSISWKEEK